MEIGRLTKNTGGGTIEAIPQNAAGKERISGELAMEIGRLTKNTEAL